MTLTASLAIYFIVWWLTLFTVLPFGIKSHAEMGEGVQGIEKGAPTNPNLLKKFIITTLISAVIFGVFYYAVERGLLDYSA